MAIDSTLEETDGAPEEGRDESTSARTPGPPRPPRPGKRSKGSGRIPMPMPQSRTELGSVEAEASAADPMEAAPGVDFAAAERDDAPFPAFAARARLPSVPEESFADLDAELAEQADHAPNAPVTPRRGMPVLSADPQEITPPRGTPFRFERDENFDSEPEPTIVGRVPDDLFELAGSGDENTRAFTAPRELIELAKRRREERAGGSLAPGEANARVTARPSGGADGDLDMSAAPPVPADSFSPAAPAVPADSFSPAAPAVPAESFLPAAPELGAAPPVRRTFSGEMEAAALPSRRARDSEPALASGPEIEIEPPSDLLPCAPRAVPDAAKASSNRASEPLSTAVPKRAFGRSWLLMFALFVVVGVVIARWRELAALFH
jgi:hypothetical protein